MNFVWIIIYCTYYATRQTAIRFGIGNNVVRIVVKCVVVVRRGCKHVDFAEERFDFFVVWFAKLSLNSVHCGLQVVLR